LNCNCIKVAHVIVTSQYNSWLLASWWTLYLHFVAPWIPITDVTYVLFLVAFTPNLLVYHSLAKSNLCGYLMQIKKMYLHAARWALDVLTNGGEWVTIHSYFIYKLVFVAISMPHFNSVFLFAIKSLPKCFCKICSFYQSGMMHSCIYGAFWYFYDRAWCMMNGKWIYSVHKRICCISAAIHISTEGNSEMICLILIDKWDTGKTRLLGT